MRWWLPWHDFTIDSPLPLATVRQLISDQVGPDGYLANQGKPFKGDVGAREFRIERAIGYRNSFRPVVIGTLTESGEGSRVHVAMRLHEFTMLVLPLFLVIFPIAFAKQGWQAVVGIVAFLLGMTLGGFWLEASRQESMLRRIFAGHQP